MNESFVVEMWNLMREYSDKRQIAVVAERYVSLLSDNGILDNILEDSIGHDDDLDDAIRELLDIDDEDFDEDEDDFGFDDYE
jgi:hypothetical protein